MKLLLSQCTSHFSYFKTENGITVFLYYIRYDKNTSVSRYYRYIAQYYSVHNAWFLEDSRTSILVNFDRVLFVIIYITWKCLVVIHWNLSIMNTLGPDIFNHMLLHFKIFLFERLLVTYVRAKIFVLITEVFSIMQWHSQPKPDARAPLILHATNLNVEPTFMKAHVKMANLLGHAYMQYF